MSVVYANVVGEGGEGGGEIYGSRGVKWKAPNKPVHIY